MHDSARQYHEMSYDEKQTILRQSEVLRAQMAARILRGAAGAIGRFISGQFDRGAHAGRFAPQGKPPSAIF